MTKLIQASDSQAAELLENYNDFLDRRVHGANMGPPGSCRPQMGLMLVPWTLLSGYIFHATNILNEDKKLLIFYNPYHACLWSGNITSQCITKNGIY